jgi:hypothetical protein
MANLSFGFPSLRKCRQQKSKFKKIDAPMGVSQRALAVGSSVLRISETSIAVGFDAVTCRALGNSLGAVHD